MVLSDRFEYIQTINNKKGYLPYATSRFKFGDEKIMIIPLQFRYRPDLISRYLYGTPKYAWLLAFINGFQKSPKDFESGTEIIYTNPTRIK